MYSKLGTEQHLESFCTHLSGKCRGGEEGGKAGGESKMQPNYGHLAFGLQGSAKKIIIMYKLSHITTDSKFVTTDSENLRSNYLAAPLGHGYGPMRADHILVYT
jgi:hypothetical protein